MSDWLLGWTPSPSPRRVGQGFGAEGAGKIFGLFLDKKFKNYDSKWLFMDVLPKLEHKILHFQNKVQKKWFIFWFFEKFVPKKLTGFLAYGGGRSD